MPNTYTYQTFAVNKQFFDYIYIYFYHSLKMKANVYTNEMMYLFLQKESNIGEYLFLQNGGHLQCFSEMIDILKPHHKAAEYKGSRVGLGPALSCWEFCSNPKPKFHRLFFCCCFFVL